MDWRVGHHKHGKVVVLRRMRLPLSEDPCTSCAVANAVFHRQVVGSRSHGTFF